MCPHHKRHAELRQEIPKHNIHAILDPCTMELATVGGLTGKRSGLKWAGEEAHKVEDLSGTLGESLIDSISEFVHTNNYTAVFAPTHFIGQTNDPWLAVDEVLTRRLRSRHRIGAKLCMEGYLT